MQYWLFQNIANEVFWDIHHPQKYLANSRLSNRDLGWGECLNYFGPE